MVNVKVAKEQAPSKTAQDLIPVRSIYNEMIETTDQRLVKVLSVSAVNTHLMSYEEEGEVLEGYESFLKNLDKPIQIARVAEPIDLKDYIHALKQGVKKQPNVHKKRILESYVDYAESLQEDRNMIRRNRYVSIDEAFSNQRSKEEAEQKLRQRAFDLKRGLEEMLLRHRLEVTELTNEELKRFLHMFFDYENAQISQLDEIKEQPYIIGPRNLIEAAEELKKKREYMY